MLTRATVQNTVGVIIKDWERTSIEPLF